MNARVSVWKRKTEKEREKGMEKIQKLKKKETGTDLGKCRYSIYHKHSNSWICLAWGRVQNHRRRHHSIKNPAGLDHTSVHCAYFFSCAVAVWKQFLHISFTPSEWLILWISLAAMPTGIGSDGDSMYKLYMMPVVVCVCAPVNFAYMSPYTSGWTYQELCSRCLMPLVQVLRTTQWEGAKRLIPLVYRHRHSPKNMCKNTHTPWTLDTFLLQHHFLLCSSLFSRTITVFRESIDCPPLTFHFVDLCWYKAVGGW